MEVCASYDLFLPKVAFWDVGAYIHIIDSLQHHIKLPIVIRQSCNAG